MDLLLFFMTALAIIVLAYLSVKYEAEGQKRKQRIVNLIVSLTVSMIPLAWFIYIIYILMKVSS